MKTNYFIDILYENDTARLDPLHFAKNTNFQNQFADTIQQ
jgi:hypothetical protein